MVLYNKKNCQLKDHSTRLEIFMTVISSFVKRSPDLVEFFKVQGDWTVLA